jgi:putative tricarboxylic transport membrane protein
MMEPVIEGLSLLADPFNIGLIFAGVLIGVLVGALPGLSSPMAVALLLPFTISLEPVAAISMMAALYCAGTFGGSITAILINAPGAPPAAATALDGYPMAQRGEAGRALGIAAVSSICGGIFSLIVFLLAAPLLARVATSFRPMEYFALTRSPCSLPSAASHRFAISSAAPSACCSAPWVFI